MSHDHLCVSFVPLFNHLVQQDQKSTRACQTSLCGKKNRFLRRMENPQLVIASGV